MREDLTDTTSPTNERARQLAFVNIFSLVGIIVLIGYGIHKYLTGMPIFAYWHWAYALLGIANLAWLLRSKNIRFAQNVILIALLPFFWITVMHGSTSGIGPMWLALYPLLAFFFKGWKRGSGWLAALLGGILLVFLQQTQLKIRTVFLAEELLLIIANLLTVSMLVYAYDSIRSDAEEKLARANRQLTDEISERQLAQNKLAEKSAQLSTTNIRLATTVEQLAELNGEKTDILEIVAHDLKAPLAGMTLSVRGLIAQYDHIAEQEKQATLDGIADMAAHMSRIVGNLLNPKSALSGKMALELALLDLSELTGKVVADYRGQAHLKNITIDFDAPANIQAYGDCAATQEVLENILSNAVKYSPFSTRILVRLQAGENFAQVDIQDQGPGLTEDDKARLFTRYAKLSAQPTGGESSTGLGLSIAKKLIGAMRGTIECESKLGAGARFVITLPGTAQLNPEAESHGESTT